ncbi:MAG: alkaline phosphatase family protein [Actinophytocola sp.]|nr:alkaline phosphatase family protein [Actinophytocola sp.]
MTEPRLILGPVLRHVDETSATVWVETDRPCAVEILGAMSRTFHVGGHHYGLVVVTGLAPGVSRPYTVSLDGYTVWPLPDSPFPASRIRTHAADQGSRLRLVFGSCRFAAPLTPRQRRNVGDDALNAYTERMAEQQDSQWPDVLLLLGDQVYADKTSPYIRNWLRQRRDTKKPPGIGVADFEECTRLYWETWSDPEIRWLMSTVSTSMIVDDHDVIDDWNTSAAWRHAMARQAWWPERIRGCLMAYWLYQHLGNLTPAELAESTLLSEVRHVGETGDAYDVLADFADKADTEVDGVKYTRWSYRRDIGSVRLVVIDTRCGRILEKQRLMVSDAEFDWIEEATSGDYEHLLIGSSLPWLLPHAAHELESLNEQACDRGGVRGWLAERVRQAIDLEHWSAFRTSFDRLTSLLHAIGSGERTTRPPASVSVLSGDVHHSYIAEAHFDEREWPRVWQVTCSPVHNTIPRIAELAFRVTWSSGVTRLVSWWARRRGVDPRPLWWRKLAGPDFRNQVAVLDIADRDYTVTFESDAQAGEPLTVPLATHGGRVARD